MPLFRVGCSLRLMWGIVAIIATLLFVPQQVQAATGSLEKLQHAARIFGDIVRGKHSLEYAGQKSGLSVIGAGFPRTGTKSIEAALISLGHRIYDVRSVVENKHEERWIKAARDWKEKEDLSELESLVKDMEAAGYTATLDMPPFLFALPLAELRPNAKVLLSVRDTPDQWYQSFTYIGNLFGRIMYCRPWIWFMPSFAFNEPILTAVYGMHHPKLRSNPEYLTRHLPWYETIHFHPHDTKEKREEWIGHYESHRKQVEEALTDDRLLTFNVKQGWEPLVSFLDIENKDLINQDFPHVNEKKTLELVGKAMHVFAAGFPLWILLLCAILAWCLGAFYRLVKRCCSRKIKSE